MEYFILEQDTRLHYTIHLPIIQYLSISDAREQNLTALPPLTVNVRPGSEHEDYPDLLSRQLFLASEALREVLALFLPETGYKIFCLWDQQKKKDFYYYAYPLPTVDCLSEKSIVTRNRRRVEKAVLRRGAMSGMDIVKAANLNCHLVLVSLPIAEAVLRRGLKGIRLTAATFDDSPSPAFLQHYSIRGDNHDRKNHSYK